MTNVEILGTYGDQIERAIVRESSNEMASFLAPYSDIWKSYVMPFRVGRGEVLRPEWLPFGGSHYSALVRVHNVLTFYNEIELLHDQGQEGENGHLMLKLQACTGAFWWSLGSAVDNLGHALRLFPGSTFTEGTEDLCRLRPFWKINPLQQEDSADPFAGRAHRFGFRLRYFRPWLP